jgi:hypothetical protein
MMRKMQVVNAEIDACERELRYLGAVTKDGDKMGENQNVLQEITPDIRTLNLSVNYTDARENHSISMSFEQISGVRFIGSVPSMTTTLTFEFEDLIPCRLIFPNQKVWLPTIKSLTPWTDFMKLHDANPGNTTVRVIDCSTGSIDLELRSCSDVIWGGGDFTQPESVHKIS